MIYDKFYTFTHGLTWQLLETSDGDIVGLRLVLLIRLLVGWKLISHYLFQEICKA